MLQYITRVSDFLLEEDIECLEKRLRREVGFGEEGADDDDEAAEGEGALSSLKPVRLTCGEDEGEDGEDADHDGLYKGSTLLLIVRMYVGLGLVLMVLLQ